MSSRDGSFRTSGAGAWAVLVSAAAITFFVIAALHTSNVIGRAAAFVAPAFGIGFAWRAYASMGVSLKGDELIAHDLFRTHRWRLSDIRGVRTEERNLRRIRCLVVVADRTVLLPHVQERRRAEPSELDRFAELVRQRIASP